MEECSKCKYYNMLFRRTIDKKTKKEAFVPQRYGYCTNKNTNRKFVRNTYYCKEFKDKNEKQN